MNTTANNELNWTLEDGRWKDSFDKFLDEKPVLREINVLKKNVRASFNLDSSVENSRNASGVLIEPKRVKKTFKVISTPIGKLPKQPFKCKISPISYRTSKALFKANNSKCKKQLSVPRNLQSTILHPSPVVVEYNSIKQTPSANKTKEDSLEILLKQPKKVGKISRLRSSNLPRIEVVSNCNSNVRAYQKNSKKRRKNLNKNTVESEAQTLIGEKTVENETLANVPITNVIDNQSAARPAVERLPIRSQRLKQMQNIGISKISIVNDEQSCLSGLVKNLEINDKSGKVQLQKRTTNKNKGKSKHLQQATKTSKAQSTNEKSLILKPFDINENCNATATADNLEENYSIASKRRKNLATSHNLKVPSSHISQHSQLSLASAQQPVLVSGATVSSYFDRNTVSNDCQMTVSDVSVENDAKTSDKQSVSNSSLQKHESKSKSSDEGMCSEVNNKNLLGKDSMITVRKSRNSFKNRLANVNEINDQTVKSPVVIPEVITIETETTGQLRRRTSRLTKNATTEILIEDALSKVQNVDRFSERRHQLEKRSYSNTKSSSKFNVSENQSLQGSGSVLPENIIEEKPSLVLSRCSLNRVSNAITTRKSNNNNTKTRSSVNEQSLRNNDDSRLAALSYCSNRNENGSQRRSSRQTTRPTTTTELNEVDVVTSAKVMNMPNLNRISDAMVTVRKSSNNKLVSEQNISIFTNSNSIVNNTETIELSTEENSRYSIRTNDGSCLVRTSSSNKTAKSSLQHANEVESKSLTDQARIVSFGECCQSIDATANSPDNFSDDQIDSSLNNAVENQTEKNNKTNERQEIVDFTIEERQSRVNKPLSQNDKSYIAAFTKRAFNSRSYGLTLLSSVQEVNEESENNIEDKTLQTMKNNEHIAEEGIVTKRKARTVKFIDLISPTIQGKNSDRAQKKDSVGVILIEPNEQTEQRVCSLENVNTKVLTSALRGKRSLKSINQSKNMNEFRAEESSRNLTANLSLQPGKWRKSLSVLRRSQITQAQIRQSCGHHISQFESILHDDDKDESVEYIGNSTFVGKRKTTLLKTESITLPHESFVNITDFKERVLRYCNQNSPLSFDSLYAEAEMQECLKIGEGVYGEVFMKKVDNNFVVCKIIPIEGLLLVNGEVQKTFETILPEIVISKALCSLKDVTSNAKQATNGFVEIKKVACVEGKYPQHLIRCWEIYDNEKNSENDHPRDFPDKQLYVVLELEFAGQDLESYIFKNAELSYAALQQIVITLAVAEEALEFEHRDLHWGNVLIRQTNKSQMQYKLSGETLTVPTKGIKATIIDYTLSRMKYDNHCFYNDLTNDEELFTATGDHQFDIYRMMRDILGTNWERFEPKTNVFWLSYIIPKMDNGVKYKNSRSKVHAQYLRKIRELKNKVLEFDSARSFAKYMLNHT